MQVVVVAPEKKPVVQSIGSDLTAMQKIVGGLIEVVYPFEEPVAIICDDEGKLTGKPLNRALRDEDGDVYDIVAGKFFIVGLGEEDFSSLHPDHIKKFSDFFKTPELFVRMNGKLIVIPMEDERVKAKKPSVLQKLNQLKSDETRTAPKKAHSKEER